MYICNCIYIHKYVCRHIQLHIYICICMRMYTYMYIHLHAPPIDLPFYVLNRPEMAADVRSLIEMQGNSLLFNQKQGSSSSHH